MKPSRVSYYAGNKPQFKDRYKKMTELTTIENYSDENGNTIESEVKIDKNFTVLFRGKNNKLTISKGMKTASLKIFFDCDNGTCHIGNNTFRGYIRIGEQCSVIIGDGVTCTENCYISAAEHTSVTIGDDCMIASANQIRTDDAHPIFDIETGERINMPNSISIGNHVWIGIRAAILGGTTIGDGSIVGMGSIVKDHFPNNCILVGAPAKIVRRDVAWERPHLTLSKPFYKPDASSVKKSIYWNKTVDR